MKEEEEELTEILDLTQDLSSEDNSPPLKPTDLEEFIKQRKRQCNSKRDRQNMKIESSTTSRPPACASRNESKTPGPLNPLQNTSSVEWTPLRLNNEEEQERRLQKLREKLSAGGQRDEMSDPWWMRFPDFVPAVLLKPMPSAGSGLDPRTGESVFVDYVNQFSRTKKTPGSSKAPVTSLEQGGTAIKNKEDNEEAGQWITKPNGQKAYITSDGKEHVGKKAYDLHLKSKNIKNKSEPKDSIVQ